MARKLFGAVLLAVLAVSTALHERSTKRRLRKPHHAQPHHAHAAKPSTSKANTIKSGVAKVRIHSPDTAGLHFSRAAFVSKDFGNLSVKVPDPAKKCTGKQDEIGDTLCHFQFGDDMKLDLSWHRSELQQGAKLELEIAMKNTTGLAAMIQVAPIKVNCPVCGGTCEFDIPTVNGLQLAPTMKDLESIPMGPAAAAMAAAKGVQVPENRTDLSKQINTLLGLAKMMKPGLFDDKAFNTEKFVFGEKTIKFPTPKCPLKQLDLPPLSTPSLGGFSASLSGDSVYLKAAVPDMDQLDSIEGVLHLKVKLTSAGKTLAAFNGELGLNKNGATPSELQQGI